MKKKDVVKLNSILNKLKEIGNTKFKYFVIKNINLLKTSLDPLIELENNNNNVLIDFKKERDFLISSIGKKDKNKIFIDQENDEMVNVFRKGLEELIEKYKENLEDYNCRLEEFEILLNEEIEENIVFKTISIDDCPECGIDDSELSFLIQHNIIL